MKSISTIVCQIHAIVELALTETTHSLASATLDILDTFAKHKLMNVNPIHVSIMVIAKISSAVIDVVVCQEHQEQTVRSMSTNAIVIPVAMEQHASMGSTNTPVSVWQDILEFIAKQTLMNAHQNHVLTVVFVLISLMDSSANVQGDIMMHVV